MRAITPQTQVPPVKIALYARLTMPTPRSRQSPPSMRSRSKSDHQSLCLQKETVRKDMSLAHKPGRAEAARGVVEVEEEAGAKAKIDQRGERSYLYCQRMPKGRVEAKPVVVEVED